MPFKEYSGQVLPSATEKDFEKDEEGFKLSSPEQIAERVGNDWWHLPAAGAGLFLLGAGATKAYDWYKNRVAPSGVRIEPTFDGGPPPPPPSRQPLSPAQQYYAQTQGVVAQTPLEKQLLEKSFQNLQAKQGPAPLPTEAPKPLTPAIPSAVAPIPSVAPVPPAAVAPSATPVAPETVPAAPAEKKARVPKAPVEQKAVLGVPPEQTPTGYYKGAVPPEVQARYAGISGAGGNYLYNILGPEKYQDFLQKYGKGLDTSNYKAAAALWEKHGAEYLQGFGPGTTKEIRKERNLKPPSLGTFGKVGESGAATLPAMLNLAGNTLGAVGLAKAYEHGKKTGDYSDFGLGVIGQLLANTVPKAATPFALMSPGGLNVNEQAELARRRGMAPTID